MMKKILKNGTCRDLLILLAITLALGIYMITQTVVISKDGVLYIERAQQIPTQLHKILSANEPIGFPAMIYATHSIRTFFLKTDTPLSWILSAQICVLVCRILSVPVLYFFGKSLFDTRKAFWGILVLLCLPYPAFMSAEVLREWPYLLFLFLSLFLLYEGVQKKSSAYLFFSGLLSGLGHLIRPECAQVVLFGIVFFGIYLTFSIRRRTAIRENWIFLMLLAGFLLILLPYANYKGNVIPNKLEKLIETTTVSAQTNSDIITADTTSSGVWVQDLLKSLYVLMQGVFENLMYFFALPATVGFYRLFLTTPYKRRESQWLLGMFISLNVLMLCLLYIHWGYISRRHVLALTVLCCFYIPCGLDLISARIDRNRQKTRQSPGTLFLILLSIGIAICIPKLLRPIGFDKSNYRDAAEWIIENTPPGTRLYTFDKRIPFYADRRYVLYQSIKRFRKGATPLYLIASSKDGLVDTVTASKMKLMATFSHAEKDASVLIYKQRR